MSLDYHDCCRLCLSKDQLLLSIFSKSQLDKMIAPKIFYCYSLFIFPQDPFSKYLCLRCLCRLEELWSFKQQCQENGRKLCNSLSADPNIKFSERYLKSIENATKTTNMHLVLSCKTPEEVSNVYHQYESLVDFSCKDEEVELIDICSDEEDSKRRVQEKVLSDSMQPAILDFNLDESRNIPSDILLSGSPKRSSSCSSDDPLSKYVKHASSSKTDICEVGQQEHEKRILRSKPVSSVDQNSNAERSLRTRSRQQNCNTDDKIQHRRGSSESSELRNLRPLLKKNAKTSEPSTRSRSSSRTRDDDAVSSCSLDSLNTVDSNVSTSSRRRGRGRKSLPKVTSDKITETLSRKRKLSTQLSNEPNFKLDKEDAAPASKRRKGAKSPSCEANIVTDTGSISEAKQIQRPFCNYCMKTFKLKIDRKQHMKVCADRKIINCKHCLKRLYREDELYKHTLCHIKVDIIRLPKNRHRCSYCDCYFYPKSALKKHKKSHELSLSKERVRKSPSLGVSADMERKDASKESTVECDDRVGSIDVETVSGSDFAFPAILDNLSSREVRSKRPRNRVALPLGNINFTRKQPLSQGLNMESRVDFVNTYCKYCRDIFKDPSELWKHMHICHRYVTVNSSTADSTENSLSYRCPDENCDKKFISLNDLILHSQMHYCLKCSNCDFSTYKFVLFLRHSKQCPRSKVKINHVICCKKKFNRRINFYIHKMFECHLNKLPLVNSDEKNEASESVNCGCCSKNIGSSAEHLMLHLIHHAQSNFSAECPYSESRQMDSDQTVFMKGFELCSKELRQETRTNSFECSECKDSFLSLQTFQAHKDRCFKPSCPKCKLNFSSNYDFVKHICVGRCKLCLSALDDNHAVCPVRKIFVTLPSRKYKCSICHSILINLTACRKHILCHFPSNNIFLTEKIECKICGEKLGNQLILDVHYHFKHSLRKKAVKQTKLPENSRLAITDNLKKTEGNERNVEKCSVDSSSQKPCSLQPEVASPSLNEKNEYPVKKNSRMNDDAIPFNTADNGATEEGCQTPHMSDLSPDDDIELENHCRSLVKGNSVKDNDLTLESITSHLSSPVYKMRGADWSWSIFRPSPSPVASSSCNPPSS